MSTKPPRTRKKKPADTAEPEANMTPFPPQEAPAEAPVVETPEPPQQVWPPATEKRHLRCRLAPNEATAYGREQSELIQQIDRLEDQKKASASEYKARIEEKSARARRLAGYITTGEEEREIGCTWIYEAAGFDTITGQAIYHPEKKILVRDDTKEVVECKDITSQERQMALPLDPEPTPEVDPDDQYPGS